MLLSSAAPAEYPWCSFTATPTYSSHRGVVHYRIYTSGQRTLVALHVIFVLVLDIYYSKIKITPFQVLRKLKMIKS